MKIGDAIEKITTHEKWQKPYFTLVVAGVIMNLANFYNKYYSNEQHVNHVLANILFLIALIIAFFITGVSVRFTQNVIRDKENFLCYSKRLFDEIVLGVIYNFGAFLWGLLGSIPFFAALFLLLNKNRQLSPTEAKSIFMITVVIGVLVVLAFSLVFSFALFMNYSNKPTLKALFDVPAFIRIIKASPAKYFKTVFTILGFLLLILVFAITASIGASFVSGLLSKFYNVNIEVIMHYAFLFTGIVTQLGAVFIMFITCVLCGDYFKTYVSPQFEKTNEIQAAEEA